MHTTLRPLDESFYAGTLHNCRYAGGVSASGQNAGFAGNLFTRDTLRILRDVLSIPQYQPFARQMLAVLPQWQGIKYDDATNEAPDALQHQVFREIIGGLQLPSELVETAEFWTGRWGVPMFNDTRDGRGFIIYNSSDAPLLYLVTLAEYCRATGDQKVMGDRFMHWPSGQMRTVAEAASRCLDFIYVACLESEAKGLHGLYAVPNTNPKQTSPSGVMRDGFDAYLRPVQGPEGGMTGAPADYAYMAYLENQALAYEALLVGARELFPTDERASQWLRLANDIRRRTFELLWMPDKAFFAAAIDRDGLITLESNAALEMLNGPFFDGVPDAPDYVRALVNWAYCPKVMTPIGPRMISLDFADLEGDYYAYQATGAVWGVTNGLFTKGLRCQGLHTPAHDMGHGRLLGWFDRTGEAMELTYVDRATNQPLYDSFKHGTAPYGTRITICPAELGQREQGWSASASMHELVVTRYGRPSEPYGSWQRDFTRDVMRMAEAVPPAAFGLTEAVVYADLKRGEELKLQRAAQLGLSA